MSVDQFRTYAWNGSAHMCIGNGMEGNGRGREVGHLRIPSHHGRAAAMR